MSDPVIEDIRLRLLEASRPLLISHMRPDGDAVGSLLGLGLALQSAGKQVQMVLPDPVPPNFRFLMGARQIRKKAERGFDLVVLLDCADLQRTDEVLIASRNNGHVEFLQPDINIDHHVTNLNFARLNYVQPEAAATSEIISRLLPVFGLPINPPIAAALLTGIVTDTIGFRTTSVTPETLTSAVRLIESGANLSEIYQEALQQHSFEAIRYWGFGLTKLQREDNFAWTSLTLADRRAVEYPGKDDADLTNVLSSIEDILVAVLFIEQGPDEVKVSWRSRPGYDVSKVALAFGGGGHPAAAGANVHGSLADVQERVLQATRSLIEAVEVG